MMRTTELSNPAQLESESEAYYRPLGHGRYRPTLHTQGAWADDEQHMGPVAGLLAHELERYLPRPELQLSRISYDILGRIPADDVQIEVSVLRPGKTIELLQAVMSVGERPVVRASAWRLSRQDTRAIRADSGPSLPPPSAMPAWPGTTIWGGGFIASLEFRMDTDSTPGRVRAWISSTKTLIESVKVHPTAQFACVVDTANGIGARLDHHDWIFPNLDLTLHLHRDPALPWVGFETSVAIGPSGVGLTSSTVYDLAGPVGSCQQILTVRERGR